MRECILTYSEIDREEWSRLVQTSATGTWFQTPEAYCFYKSLPEIFRPFVVGLASLEDRLVLRGVCVGYVTKEKNPIKQFFTRRAIIIGGPAIVDDACSEEVELLMKAVREQLQVSDFRFQVLDAPIYVETRNFNDYSRWKDAFERAGFSYKPHLNFHVDCTDKEKMWERMSDTRKKQIRRVRNEGVKELTNEGIKEQEIREWYKILERLYRTKVKTPLWPMEFFLEAYRQGIGKFLLVKYEGKVIGGLMMVVWRPTSDSSLKGRETATPEQHPSFQGQGSLSIEQNISPAKGRGIANCEEQHPSLQGRTEDRLGTVYEWFECGLNAEYKEQYPAVMATWAGMEYAAEHDIPRCDFMGAGEPGVPYGVRDFKEKFGGELVEHGRFLYIAKPMLYQIGKLGVKILKQMK